MGARPLWALVSLGLPDWVDDAFLAALYRGIGDLAARHATAVVGGNLTRLPERLAVDVAVVGAAAHPILRSGALPGDVLYVTGPLGGAAADLTAGRHREPAPRVREGLALAATGRVHAMIDVSDGLAQDLGHICSESGVGAALDGGAIPLAPGATLEQALHGGEDYELLLAAPPGADLPVPLHRIGEVRPRGEGPTIDGRPLDARGWDHFAATV
jgi:thiamine-monophosphate kinase